MNHSSRSTTAVSHQNAHSAPPESKISNPALTIQSAFRAHRIRTLYRKISTVDSEADRLQRLIQRQETVDAVRTNPLQKLAINESLMSLLLTLDSVPGFDPTVREARRKITRRIVSLQEILDSVSECKFDEWGWWNSYDDVLVRNWDQVIEDMEESVCRERGGDDMDKFCAQYLGFRCLQRFLREP
ncbi:BAG family molecular chaperone regulator 5, mitochondrial [Arachis duranensis]|uniref:BAG family molecular chaperone regulator 5, mitochondrial n=1 Tax=Arachis duranensis TaxID=130453 RepID=A0A6P4CZK5_ARADU|nr:BAG family molecular chaperone regulator 5, mitochondrial [Arachis duranensis]